MFMVRGPDRFLGLPDLYAIFGSEIEFVGWFDVEGGIPGVVVANGGCAELGGSVWVGEYLLTEDGVTEDTAPVLTEGYEELLVAVEGSIH